MLYTFHSYTVWVPWTLCFVVYVAFFCNFVPLIMPLKRKGASSDGSASKKRKDITMEVKLDTVKHSEKGETPTNIDCALGHVKGLAPMHSTVIMEQRSGLIIEIERLLLL